ncbi:MAG: hypothetical protein K1X72_17035 [Pyrinomonadaceae bacterium]|nr:hypothetical protein [Pyrinomonadaceae bacterium]
MDIESLKYIFFGASILFCFFSFLRSEKLIEPSFFNKSAVIAVISTIIGILFEKTNIFDMPVGIALVLMSLTTIYLLYFRILHIIFLKWKRFDPHPMSRIQDIGHYPFNKSKNKRVVIWEDFVFTTLHVILPIFSILFLLFYFAGRL